jgi:acyl transferase domain-containing protein
MFGGQGSQYYQMGRDLYAADPILRSAVDACSGIVAPIIGESLADIIYRERPDRFAPFDRLLHSNPAICAVQYGVAETLKARGLWPDRVLGYSLGCITAEIVTGALSLHDGLRMAILLAELSERHLPPGGMLAVLGDPESFPDTWLAAHNFATHYVLAGTPPALAAASARLTERGVSVQALPVRYAFHCPLIDPIRDAFTAFAATCLMREPAVRVINRRSPWEAIRQPVDFKATIEALEACGAYRYVDIGPSGTLATFVKYNLRRGSGSTIASTVTPFDRALVNIRQIEAGFPPGRWGDGGPTDRHGRRSPHAR